MAWRELASGNLRSPASTGFGFAQADWAFAPQIAAERRVLHRVLQSDNRVGRQAHQFDQLVPTEFLLAQPGEFLEHALGIKLPLLAEETRAHRLWQLPQQ